MKEQWERVLRTNPGSGLICPCGAPVDTLRNFHEHRRSCAHLWLPVEIEFRIERQASIEAELAEPIP